MTSNAFSEHALLRQESFGGTLFLVSIGKRTYVSKDEFLRMKSTGWIWDDLAAEIGIKPCPIIVNEPSHLPSNSFSAPDTVFLEITRACNLRCSHCFNRSGRTGCGEMDDSELVSVVRDITESGVQEIRFTGGEPLIRKSLPQLIALAAHCGLRCSVGTNATMIDPERAAVLKSAGLHSAIVSIEGLEHRHDAIRGPGTFRKAMSGLNNLIEQGIIVRVNVVAMRSNLPDLKSLLEQMVDRRIPVFVRRLISTGRAADSDKETLTARDYDNLHFELRHLLDHPNGLIEGHYLSNHPKIVIRVPLPFERTDCSAGRRGLVLLPDGNVQTCGFLGPVGEPSIGSLRTERLKDIWLRLASSGHIERLERRLVLYNQSTKYPKTNCLAIALAAQDVGRAGATCAGQHLEVSP